MTIVCGTDFSPASIAACEVAALIAAAHGEPLILVHAVAPATAPPPHDAERGLRDLAARLGNDGGQVSTSAPAGAPDEVLLAEVERTGARMIVLGSVGGRGLKILLGSTSDRIASRTPVPLLVVRGELPAAAWLRDRKPLRVAVAADLGPSTDMAVQWASRLVERGPCEFVAMHVSWPPEDYARLAIDAPMHLDRTHPLVEQVIRRELDGVASRLEGSGETKIVVESNVGKTGAAIAEVASREGADLLVVGRRRDEGRHWWERSVSREVIREAPMSVVCVPEDGQPLPAAAPSIRRVLCATDFSPLGNSAVVYANGLLPQGGELMLVHVIDDDASNEQREAARQQLQSLVKGAANANVTVEVMAGHDPGQLITAAAERFAADVICVGSRGRAALTKAMLGSVSQGILLAATCPVLMVPAPL
ncbi:MAG TPA: universal stress protein, partial [Thermoanaerobaculia bacterium]|nr:universal stress protein [Thermoanaerobaculia bacterium]